MLEQDVGPVTRAGRVAQQHLLLNGLVHRFAHHSRGAECGIGLRSTGPADDLQRSGLQETHDDMGTSEPRHESVGQ
jgi:hypothetical protein